MVINIFDRVRRSLFFYKNYQYNDNNIFYKRTIDFLGDDGDVGAAWGRGRGLWDAFVLN